MRETLACSPSTILHRFTCHRRQSSLLPLACVSFWHVHFAVDPRPRNGFLWFPRYRRASNGPSRRVNDISLFCDALFSVMSAGNKSADEVVNDALLEKLRTYAAKPQEAGDALRAIAAKILARVTSSGTQLQRQTRRLCVLEDIVAI